MLLRNRSRAVTKPTLMADHNNIQNSITSRTRTIIPSLFGSPKFNMSSFSATRDVLKSPTSTLDTKLLSPNYTLGNPFSYDNNTKIQIKTFLETRSSWEKSVSRGIGLALVSDEVEEIHENICGEPNKGNVLFGKQLRVKIPPPSTTFSPINSETCDRREIVVTTGVMSLNEMELSEEYTCVTSHGPNPKTTHIFNNCIVESYCCSSSLPQNSASRNFLSVCYTCKKHLDQTKDIFIYRGEKAFCSRECRQREMVLDGVEEESLEFENSNGYYYC